MILDKQFTNSRRWALLGYTMSVLMFCASCTETKKRVPTFYDSVPSEDSVLEEVTDTAEAPLEYQTSRESMSDEIVVPFRRQGKVKLVRVRVNGIPFEMIFDTGCSTTLISVAEANYLYQKGVLSADDVLGFTQSQIADGSIVEDMVVNLRQVIIDDQIECDNVTATVSDNVQAPLLLGNDVLDRLATVTIDNQNDAILFRLK